MFLSNLSLRIRVYAFFISLVLVSTINFVLIAHLENQSIQDFANIRNVSKAIKLESELLQHLVDSETGQRGYIITGEMEYLQPYFESTVKANKKIEAINSLVGISSTQKEVIMQIEQLIGKKIAEMQSTIDLYKSGKIDEAIAVIKNSTGKILMDEIRNKLTLLNQENTLALDAKQDKLENLQQFIRNIFIAETVIFGIILFLLGIVVSKTILNPLSKLYLSVISFDASKEFTPVVISNRDEIGALAIAFNSMGEQVVKKVNRLNDATKDAEKERDIAVIESISDPLTGLSNRRYLEVELRKQILSSHRYSQKLCLIMLDIDHFKKVNDTYGHVIGDIVLVELAKLIKNEVRGSDLAIRFGGEEFIVVLSHTAIKDAKDKAEQLRKKVEQLQIAELKGNNITISLGVTELKEDDHDATRFISRADEALYIAKNSGRNCCKTI